MVHYIIYEVNGKTRARRYRGYHGMIQAVHQLRGMKEVTFLQAAALPRERRNFRKPNSWVRNRGW